MSKLNLVAPAYKLGSTVFGATLATTMAFSAAAAEQPMEYDYIFGGYAYGGYTDLSGKGDFECLSEDFLNQRYGLVDLALRVGNLL